MSFLLPFFETHERQHLLKHQPVNGQIGLRHDNTLHYMQLLSRLFTIDINLRCSFTNCLYHVIVNMLLTLHCQCECNKNASNLLLVLFAKRIYHVFSLFLLLSFISLSPSLSVL